MHFIANVCIKVQNETKLNWMKILSELVTQIRRYRFPAYAHWSGSFWMIRYSEETNNHDSKVRTSVYALEFHVWNLWMYIKTSSGINARIQMKWMLI